MPGANQLAASRSCGAIPGCSGGRASRIGNVRRAAELLLKLKSLLLELVPVVGGQVGLPQGRDYFAELLGEQ